jgi:hypothetical protein
MGWKLVIVVGLVILWIIWPKIRIPKTNYFRRKFGAFSTYVILIMGILAILQIFDYILHR